MHANPKGSTGVADQSRILGLVTQALRLLHTAKPAGDIKQNLPSQNSDSTVTTRPNISVTATIDEQSSENSTGWIDEEPTMKTEEKRYVYRASCL